MNMNVKDKIITARITLLFKQPFFGNMATRMQLKECSDWCATAATDGRHLYYNEEFFTPMTTDQVIFVIAHEVLHTVFNHMDRREYRNHRLFNIACDYAVNDILIKERIGSPPKIKYLHDVKYRGMSAEQIYDLLMEEHGDDGSGLGDLGVLLDEHLDWDAKDENGNPKYTEQQKADIRNEVISSIIQAVQTCQAGQVPGDVLRLVQQMTEPQMNWRQVLRTQIQSLVKNDFTWTRPSRKAWHTGAIMPGVNYDETIDVAVALDMSGSITNEQVSDFLGEVKGIMDEFKDFKIDLWTFDTSPYNHQTFTGDNADDLLTYEAKGGGGTDFMVNWEFMQEQGIMPKRFIMFTDGYCNSRGFGDPDYCDTLFIMHNSDVVAPFGDTVYYSR